MDTYTKRNPQRMEAHALAVRLACRHSEPYMVFRAHRGGSDGTGDIWQCCPLGDRPDVGGYVPGCLSYVVNQKSDYPQL
jgi:hypothetical protein